MLLDETVPDVFFNGHKTECPNCKLRVCELENQPFIDHLPMIFFWWFELVRKVFVYHSQEPPGHTY